MALPTHYIEHGWDQSRVGEAEFTITGDVTGAQVVTLSTGLYYHLIDGSTVSGSTPLATYLTDVASGDWDAFFPNLANDEAHYEFEASGANSTISISFSGPKGDLAKRILGFSGNVSAASNVEGDTTVDVGLILPSESAFSDVSDEYEPSGISEGMVADDGSTYSLARLGSPRYYDFLAPMEPYNKVFKRGQSTWTYQDLFETARSISPILVGTGGVVRHMRLRPDADNFKPVRQVEDWDGAWNVPFRCYYYGTL